jgi:UDP-N-acetylmuramyl tripeptide synthase
MEISEQHETAWPVEIAVPGLYNAYNVLAAAAVTRTLGLDERTIARALASFKSAFGRIERISYRDRSITIALVKNPVGFNEVLRMLVGDGRLELPAMIAINDLAADGRDVSWLWDVDFELLAGEGASIATAGIRGSDMANRLKYAGVNEDRIKPLGEDLSKAVESFVEQVPEGGSGYILPTYTAMLAIRQAFADLGAVEQFWEQ